MIDLKAVGVATFDFPDPDCGPFVMQFAISSYYRQSHADAQAIFNVDLDVNRDGKADFEIYNFDATNSFSGARDGRNVVFVANLRTGLLTGADFFVDHALEASNYVFTVCASALVDSTAPGGAIAATPGSPMNMVVFAQEIQSVGNVTDVLSGIRRHSGAERVERAAAEHGNFTGSRNRCNRSGTKAVDSGLQNKTSDRGD